MTEVQHGICKPLTSLENNYLFGVAATTANTVHVIGWNYVSGGGNVFRSADGGDYLAARSG